MDRLSKLLSAGILALTLLGCVGTETGNPGSQVELTISARTSDEASVTLNGATSELQVDTALIHLENVMLVSCSGNEIASLPETVVDLTQLEATPFVLDATSRNACELGFDVTVPAADSGPLGAYALVIGGARADGIPFQINSLLETRVTLSASEAFAIKELILAFDLAVWLDPAELHEAALHEEVAQIDDVANPDILAAVEARIALGAQLFVDADGDGQLDADESEPVAQAE